MSNYTIAVAWSGKDALSDSNPAKVISGDDFNTEFTAVQTAVNTKAELNGSATESFSATTASAGTNTTQVATTAYVQTELGDYTTTTNPTLNGTISGTGFKDEDDMASDSATALASQQSIKAYVDAQVASATMTWTYITRTTLVSVSGLSNNTWSTQTIPGTIPSTASAIIISVYLDTDDSSNLTMYLKSSSVSERSIGYSISDNNSDDSSGSFNTITIPYTSTIDVKYSGSNQITGHFYIDGYIS